MHVEVCLCVYACLKQLTITSSVILAESIFCQTSCDHPLTNVLRDSLTKQDTSARPAQTKMQTFLQSATEIVHISELKRMAYKGQFLLFFWVGGGQVQRERSNKCKETELRKKKESFLCLLKRKESNCVKVINSQKVA